MEDINEIDIEEAKKFIEELCKKIDLALLKPLTETMQ